MMIKEVPGLFNTAMVRAILAGHKTQTRRPMKRWGSMVHNGKRLKDWPLSKAPRPWKGEPIWNLKGKRPQEGDWIEEVQIDVDDTMSRVLTPPWRVGDRIWVREAFMHQPAEYEWTASCSIPLVPAKTTYRADFKGDSSGLGWTPSIHMPRSLCRLLLPVVYVGSERVCDISEDDAKAEGVRQFEDCEGVFDPVTCSTCGGSNLKQAVGSCMGVTEIDCLDCDTYQNRFRNLWISIYGPESWDNDRVWVAKWKRAERI